LKKLYLKIKIYDILGIIKNKDKMRVLTFEIKGFMKGEV